jgi:hypothetical protein
MGKLSGSVLILAGVAAATYALATRDDADTKVATAHGAKAVDAVAVTSLTVPAPKPRGEAAPVAQSAPPETAPPAPAVANDPPDPAATAPVSPTSSPPALAPPPAVRRQLRPAVPAVALAEAPARVPVGETGAAAPIAGPALTREIQRQLRRIGCYRGEVSGVWSPSVRQAMKVLTDRVNASLPVEQPDPVLLAMTQSQAPGICGAACPSGQDRAADGRCLPSALVASAAKRRTPTPSGVAQAKPARAAARTPVAAAPQSAADAEPADGRMSLAGPPPPSAPRRTNAARRAPTQYGRAAVTWSRPAYGYGYGYGRQRQRAAQRPPYGGFSLFGLPF